MILDLIVLDLGGAEFGAHLLGASPIAIHGSQAMQRNLGSCSRQVLAEKLQASQQ
jgi:hypothetical protein